MDVQKIQEFIEKELKDSKDQILEQEEIGEILEIDDGIVTASGLRNVSLNELVEFENGSKGLVLNLLEDAVGIITLGNISDLGQGQKIKRLNKLLSIEVGEGLLGRVIDPLGNPLDNLGEISYQSKRLVDIVAPGIASRQSVKVPLQTGIKAIDAMIPIGRGQRELIIGDRETGKTTIAIDTIINQKDSGVICVYVAIGQKASTIAMIIDKLKENKALDHTVVVSTTANNPASLLYIAPYVGCAIAEYFMYEKGRDTLCVYDDLTKQANAYRELSLFLKRAPGREAYPGDVFYLHSRLLERAVKLSDKLGGGSLTALPIIETQEGEVSAYIPTNVISITDGQIYLTPRLFAKGIRPAIDVGISVSRVGGNAQSKLMKKIAGSLRLDMSQFRSLESFAQFGSDIDESSKKQLKRGFCLTEILKQPQYSPLSLEEEVLVLYASMEGFFDSVPLKDIKTHEASMLSFFRKNYADILEKIRSDSIDLTKLKEVLKDYKNKKII